MAARATGIRRRRSRGVVGALALACFFFPRLDSAFFLLAGPCPARGFFGPGLDGDFLSAEAAGGSVFCSSFRPTRGTVQRDEAGPFPSVGVEPGPRCRAPTRPDRPRRQPDSGPAGGGALSVRRCGLVQLGRPSPLGLQGLGDAQPVGQSGRSGIGVPGCFRRRSGRAPRVRQFEDAGRPVDRAGGQGGIEAPRTPWRDRSPAEPSAPNVLRVSSSMTTGAGGATGARNTRGPASCGCGRSATGSTPASGAG